MPNPAAPPNALVLTDLQTQLAGPAGDALRQAHLRRLHALAAHLHAELGRGLRPDGYATGRGLAHALDAAISILDDYATIADRGGRAPSPISLSGTSL